MTINSVHCMMRWLIETAYMSSYEQRAELIIAKLTEQGIPIDKLLSGEMRAVDAEWCARAQLKMEGHAISHTDRRGTSEAFKQAQADYAGNPPITPEGS